MPYKVENSTTPTRKLATGFLAAIFYLAGYSLLLAQTAALIPNARQQFFNSNGQPLAGGSATFYVPNTTTPKSIWLDENEATLSANPITLDSGGFATIFGQGNYREIVKDASNNLIFDGFTSAYGASTPSGATGSDTAPVGTLLPWAGFNFNVPTNWALAYGQALSRTTYAQLMTAITISTTTGNCTATSTTISGFADTSQMAVGAPIESSCLPTGDTVASIVNGTTITVSVAATATGTFTVTAFPWGNGDGVTTFNVPDLRGRVLPGADAMGGSAAGRLTSTYYGASASTPAVAGGLQHQNKTFTLAQNQLPNIAPAFSGTLHDFGDVVIATGSTFVGGVVTSTGGLVAFNGGSLSNSDVSYTPAGSVASINGNVTQQSVPLDTTTVQPSLTMDYIIKIAPNTTGAGGVVSANGLFGDVLWLAGTGMSVSTASPNITYSCIPALASVIGCVKPDGVTTTVNASGMLTAIGAATSAIDAGGATSISNGLAGDLLYDNAGKVGHETLLPLANGGLAASMSSATANQIPVFPGGGSAAVATSAPTWFDNAYCNTIGYIIARTTGGWTCSGAIPANAVWLGADSTGVISSSTAFATCFASSKCYIPAGTYKISTQVVGSHGVEIYGDGFVGIGGNCAFNTNCSTNISVAPSTGTNIIPATGIGPAFKFTTNDAIHIHDIEVLYTTLPTAGSGDACFEISGAGAPFGVNSGSRVWNVACIQPDIGLIWNNAVSFGEDHNLWFNYRTSATDVQGASTATTTGNTNGTTTLTLTGSTAGIYAGSYVRDTTNPANITAGTTVSSIVSSTVTLSATATGTHSGDTFVFSTNISGGGDWTIGPQNVFLPGPATANSCYGLRLLASAAVNVLGNKFNAIPAVTTCAAIYYNPTIDGTSYEPNRLADNSIEGSWDGLDMYNSCPTISTCSASQGTWTGNQFWTGAGLFNGQNVHIDGSSAVKWVNGWDFGSGIMNVTGSGSNTTNVNIAAGMAQNISFHGIKFGATTGSSTAFNVGASNTNIQTSGNSTVGTVTLGTSTTAPFTLACGTLETNGLINAVQVNLVGGTGVTAIAKNGNTIISQASAALTPFSMILNPGETMLVTCSAVPTATYAAFNP